MKNLKTATLASCIMFFTATACQKDVRIQFAADKTPASVNSHGTSRVTVQDLPKKVQDFLNKNYAGIAIAKTEVKTNINGKEYEVRLNNGVEIEFNTDDDWEEVKDYNGVSTALIPAKIQTYVDTNYNGIKIEKMEVKSHKIEIDLLNGIELEFDKAGNFVRIDD